MRKTTKLLSLVLAIIMIVGIVPVAALEDGNFEVTIRLRLPNGTPIGEPISGASIAPGEPYVDDWDIPQYAGYTVTCTGYNGPAGTITKSGDKLYYNLTNVQENIEVVILYTPQINIAYRVEHRQQNLDGEGYTVVTADTQYLEVTTGETPTITPKTYQGFHVRTIVANPCAGDGSTVSYVLYDRDNVLLKFNLHGGYGVLPIFDRYGTSATVGTPLKVGYNFTGWSEMIGMDEEAVTIPSPIILETNRNFSANWEEGDANYSVNYWVQDADDTTKYAYYCSETKTAKTGSTVSGAAKTGGFTSANASDYADINRYFTFGHADQNVPVKADGSTIVNVYYDREEYDIVFKLGKKVHHDEENTPGSTTYKYSYVGTLTGVTGGSGYSNNTSGVLVGKTGPWTPLYRKLDSDCSGTLLQTWRDLVGVYDSKGQSNYDYYRLSGDVGEVAYQKNYGGTSIGSYRFVPLYNNAKVRILDDKEVYSFKGPAADLKTMYHVEFDFKAYDAKGNLVDKTYTGYVFTKFLPDSAIETHTETITVQPTHVDAYDEYYYWTRYADAELPAPKDSPVPSITIGGQTYYEEYTIHVRFGQDVTNIWPARATIEPTVDGLNFKCLYSAQNSISETITDQYIISAPLLNQAHLGDPDYTTTYYVTYHTASYKTTLRYRDESDKTDDENGFLIDKQICYFNGYNDTLESRDFPGYEYIGKGHSYTDRYGNRYSRADYNNYGEGGEVYTFFFARNEYPITYHNAGDPVYRLQAKYKDSLTGTDELTRYQEALPYGFDGSADVAYNHVPAAPVSLPDQAYTFDGWYADPEFTEEFNFNTTMPAHGVELFAKWVPKTFTVNIYKGTNGELVKEAEEIAYNYYAHNPDPAAVQAATPEGTTFLGFFYRDENNVEHPFDFEAIPITKNYDIYLKFQNDTAIPYTIHYVLNDDHSVDVAPSVRGTTTTDMQVNAAVGASLYPQYQEGYFPTKLMDDFNAYTDNLTDYYFYYVQAESAPYRVRYMEQTEDGLVQIGTDVEKTNKKAVVDVTAEVPTGYVLAAGEQVTKRLLCVADPDFTEDENTVIFICEKSNLTVTVTYLIQTEIGSDNYEEYTVLADSYGATYGQVITEEPADDAMAALGYIPKSTLVNDTSTNVYTYTIGVDTLAKDGLGYVFKYDLATFQIVHSTDPENPETLAVKDCLVNGLFDITTKVKEGYLYGGLGVDGFEEADDSVCGLELEPENGDIFYLHEVDDDFLQPKMLSTRVSGEITRYLLTALDKEGVDAGFYQSYGFIFDRADAKDEEKPGGLDERTKINGEIDNTELDVNAGENDDYYAIYESIVINAVDPSKNKVYYPGPGDGVKSSIFSQSEVIKSDNAYLGCVPFDFTEDVEVESGTRTSTEFEYDYHYMPYFVTQDGVAVTGTVDRYVKDADRTATSVKTEDATELASLAMPLEAEAEPQQAQAPKRASRLMVRSVSNIGEPVVIVPEEPEIIEEPEIVEEGAVTVWMVVNGETSHVSAQPGDFTNLVEVPAPDGLLFAGWFTDEEYTYVADLSDVQGDITIFGKCIADSYFKVAYTTTVSKKVVTKVTIISAFDNWDAYKEIGFTVKIGEEEGTDYAANNYSSSIGGKKPQKYFGTGVDAASKLYSRAISTTGLVEGDEIVVTPYCITLDGSRVNGTPTTFVYHVSNVAVQ